MKKRINKDAGKKENKNIQKNITITQNKSENKKQNPVKIIIQGDIYGFNDFKEKVAKAMYEVIHIDGSNVAVAK